MRKRFEGQGFCGKMHDPTTSNKNFFKDGGNKVKQKAFAKQMEEQDYAVLFYSQSFESTR